MALGPEGDKSHELTDIGAKQTAGCSSTAMDALSWLTPPLTCPGSCPLFARRPAEEEEKGPSPAGLSPLWLGRRGTGSAGARRALPGAERPTAGSTLDLLLLPAFPTLTNGFQRDGARGK